MEGIFINDEKDGKGIFNCFQSIFFKTVLHNSADKYLTFRVNKLKLFKIFIFKGILKIKCLFYIYEFAQHILFK